MKRETIFKEIRKASEVLVLVNWGDLGVGHSVWVKVAKTEILILLNIPTIQPKDYKAFVEEGRLYIGFLNS